MIEIFNILASAATTVGIIIAAWQLRVSAKQSVTDFEDALASEYRSLAASLPVEALLGGILTDDEHKNALDQFYHYFDLSNCQIFLRQKGRVSKRTFDFWRDGIVAHLRRPAFARAWDDISSRVPNDFKELRQLIAVELGGDLQDHHRIDREGEGDEE